MIYTNLFYFNSILTIGGIETWFYYLSIFYKNIDITVMYQNGDNKQINRLKKRFRCVKWNGKDTVECQNLFVNFNREIIEHAIVHNKIYLVLHGDYKDMVNRKQLKEGNIPLDERVEYIGISKTVCDSWYQLTGKKASLSYNPVVKFKPLKQIRLVSAQRLSNEKGGKRIEKLIYELDRYCYKYDADYVYDIYTNDYGKRVLNGIARNKHVNIKEPRLDINRLLNNYDYTICLSDNEGYCYTAVESLVAGTPCVITPLPVFKELGFNAKNSITLEFDCSNIEYVVKSMFQKKFDFQYKEKKDSYHEFLIDMPNTYIYEKEESMAKIKALMNYEDKHEGKSIKKGDVYETSEERAKQIVEAVYVSKVSGMAMKYAEHTNDDVNVEWQMPFEEHIEEPSFEIAEDIPNDVEEVLEEPKREVTPKKERKKKSNKTK